MGHNLGMRHDFDPNPGDDKFCTTDGSSCTDDGGVMDYFQVSLFKIFFLLEKTAFCEILLCINCISVAKGNITVKFQKITKNCTNIISDLTT